MTLLGKFYDDDRKQSMSHYTNKLHTIESSLQRVEYNHVMVSQL